MNKKLFKKVGTLGTSIVSIGIASTNITSCSNSIPSSASYIQAYCDNSLQVGISPTAKIHIIGVGVNLPSSDSIGIKDLPAGVQGSWASGGIINLSGTPTVAGTTLITIIVDNVSTQTTITVLPQLNKYINANINGYLEVGAQITATLTITGINGIVMPTNGSVVNEISGDISNLSFSNWITNDNISTSTISLNGIPTAGNKTLTISIDGVEASTQLYIENGNSFHFTITNQVQNFSEIPFDNDWKTDIPEGRNFNYDISGTDNNVDVTFSTTTLDNIKYGMFGAYQEQVQFTITKGEQKVSTINNKVFALSNTLSIPKSIDSGNGTLLDVYQLLKEWKFELSFTDPEFGLYDEKFDFFDNSINNLSIWLTYDNKGYWTGETDCTGINGTTGTKSTMYWEQGFGDDYDVVDVHNPHVFFTDNSFTPTFFSIPSGQKIESYEEENISGIEESFEVDFTYDNDSPIFIDSIDLGNYPSGSILYEDNKIFIKNDNLDESFDNDFIEIKFINGVTKAFNVKNYYVIKDGNKYTPDSGYIFVDKDGNQYTSITTEDEPNFFQTFTEIN